MGSYNFKSSGKTTEQRQVEKLLQTKVAYGIKTPLQLSDTGELLVVNYKIADQMHDNLKNLLLTNWGERLGFYNFGANLWPLVTEFVSQDDFDTEAINRIRVAVEHWMPYVDLENFLSEINRFDNKNTAIVNVNITYNIPTLQVVGRKLQITLYPM